LKSTHTPPVFHPRSGALRARWVNLWPPADFAKSFTPASTSDESDAGQQDDDTERDDAPSLTSEISSFVFMGNFLLFLALLVGIFLLHVAVASGVEAYWITKVWKVLDGALELQWPGGGGLGKLAFLVLRQTAQATSHEN